MVRKTFLRSKWRTYSKLGRGRKKIQKYRKARGRHNKVRESMKSNPIRVEIGYKKQKKQELQTKMIHNVFELDGVSKGDTIILAKIGQKNKMKIIEKAKENGIIILNLNVKKFNRKIEQAKREKQTKKKEKEEKKKTRDKKAKVKMEEKKTEEKKSEETLLEGKK